MHQDQLNSLLLMFIESEVTFSFYIDTVIHKFKIMENKRVHLIFSLIIIIT